MSYILEALKKSELQREIGQVPGIDSEHEKPRRHASGKWLWAGIGVLLLNAGLLAVLLWPPAEPPAQQVASRVAEPAPAQQPVPQSRLLNRQPAEPAPATVRQQPLLQREAVPVRAAPPVVASLPQVASPPPVVQAPVVEPRASASQVQVAPAPVVSAGAGDLPLWPQIPGHLFRQLRGGLRLDVHVYSAMPQDRFVLINLQKYREGDELQEGPMLDAITSEGVILSFQGQQFRVSAQ